MGCGLSAFCKRSKRGDSPPLDAPIRRNVTTPPKPSHLPLSESPHDDQPRPLQANIDLPAIDEESPIDVPTQLPVFLTVTKRKSTPESPSESPKIDGSKSIVDDVSQSEQSRDNSFFTPTYKDGFQEDEQYDEITDVKAKEEFLRKDEEHPRKDKEEFFDEVDQLAATKIQASYRGFRTRRALATGAAVAGAVGIGFFPLKKEADETPSTSTLAIVPEIPACESPTVSFKGSSRDSAEPRSVNGYYLLKDGAEASASDLNLPESSAYQVSEPDEGKTQDLEEIMTLEPGEDTDPLLRDDSDEEATENQCGNLIDFGADVEADSNPTEEVNERKYDEPEEVEESAIQPVRVLSPETSPAYEEKRELDPKEPVPVILEIVSDTVPAASTLEGASDSVEADESEIEEGPVCEEDAHVVGDAIESEVQITPSLLQEIETPLDEVAEIQVEGKESEEAFVNEMNVENDSTDIPNVDIKGEDVADLKEEKERKESVDLQEPKQQNDSDDLFETENNGEGDVTPFGSTPGEVSNSEIVVTEEPKENCGRIGSEENDIKLDKADLSLESEAVEESKRDVQYFISRDYSLELYEVNSASVEKSVEELASAQDSLVEVKSQTAEEIAPGFDSQFLNAVSTHKSFDGMGETLEEAEDIVVDEIEKNEEPLSSRLTVENTAEVNDSGIGIDDEARLTEEAQTMIETSDLAESGRPEGTDEKKQFSVRTEYETDNEIEIIIQKSIDLDDEIASVILSALSDDHSQRSSRVVSKETSFAAVDEIDEDASVKQTSILKAESGENAGIPALDGISDTQDQMFDEVYNVETDNVLAKSQEALDSSVKNDSLITIADDNLQLEELGQPQPEDADEVRNKMVLTPTAEMDTTEGCSEQLSTQTIAIEPHLHDTNVENPEDTEEDRNSHVVIAVAETVADVSDIPVPSDISYEEQPKSAESIDLVPSVYKESSGSSINDSSLVTTTEGVACDRSLTEVEVDLEENVEPRLDRKGSEDQVVADILLNDFRRLSADLISTSFSADANNLPKSHIQDDSITKLVTESETDNKEQQFSSHHSAEVLGSNPIGITITADDVDDDEYIWRKLQGNLSVDDDDIYCKAATKIQATYRGYCTRKFLRDTTPDTQVTDLSDDDRHRDVLNDIENSGDIIEENVVREGTSVDLVQIDTDLLKEEKIADQQDCNFPKDIDSVSMAVATLETSECQESISLFETTVLEKLEDTEEKAFEEVGRTDDERSSDLCASPTTLKTVESDEETGEVKEGEKESQETEQTNDDDLNKKQESDFIAVSCDFVSPAVVSGGSETSGQLDLEETEEIPVVKDEEIKNEAEKMDSLAVDLNSLNTLELTQENLTTLEAESEDVKKSDDSVDKAQTENLTEEDKALSAFCDSLTSPVIPGATELSQTDLKNDIESCGEMLDELTMGVSQRLSQISESTIQNTDQIIREQGEQAGKELLGELVEQCGLIAASDPVELEIVPSLKGEDEKTDGHNNDAVLVDLPGVEVNNVEDKVMEETLVNQILNISVEADAPIAISCNLFHPSLISEANQQFNSSLTDAASDETEAIEETPGQELARNFAEEYMPINALHDLESTSVLQDPVNPAESSIQVENQEDNANRSDLLLEDLSEDSHPIVEDDKEGVDEILVTATSEAGSSSGLLFLGELERTSSVDSRDQKSDVASSDRGSEESNMSLQTIIACLESVNHQSGEQSSNLKNELDADIAATKIQARFRGYMVRKNINEIQEFSPERGQEVDLEDEDVSEEEHTEELQFVADAEASSDILQDREDAAATKIQAVFRGYQVRKNLGGCSELVNVDEITEEDVVLEQTAKEKYVEEESSEKTEIEDAAATKIQAVFRGHQVRKNMTECGILGNISESHDQQGGVKEEVIDLQEEVIEQLNDLSSSVLEDEEAAATKIQAVFRGHQVRKNRNDRRTPADDSRTSDDELHDHVDEQPAEIANGNVLESSYQAMDDTTAVVHLTIEDEAAVKIQAAFRGHQVRKSLMGQAGVQNEEEVLFDSDKPDNEIYHAEPVCCVESAEEDEEKPCLQQSNIPNEIENVAATKIQAVFRGHQVRKNITDFQHLDVTLEREGGESDSQLAVQDCSQDLLQPILDKEEMTSEDKKTEVQTCTEDENAVAAAVTIQVAFRAYQARKTSPTLPITETCEQKEIPMIAMSDGCDPENEQETYEATVVEMDLPGLEADFLLTTHDRSREGSSSSRTTPELSEDDAARRIQGAYRALRSLRTSREPSPANLEINQQVVETMSEDDAAKKIQEKFRALRNRRKKTPEITKEVVEPAFVDVQQEKTVGLDGFIEAKDNDTDIDREIDQKSVEGMEAVAENYEQNKGAVHTIFDELVSLEPESMIPDSLEPPFIRRDSGTPIDSLELVPAHLLNDLGPFAGVESAAADFEPDSLSTGEKINTDSLDLLKEMAQKQEKILEEEILPVDSLVSDLSESELRPSEISDFLRDIDAERFPQETNRPRVDLLALDGTDEASSVHSNGLEDFLKAEEMISETEGDVVENPDIVLGQEPLITKVEGKLSAEELALNEPIGGADVDVQTKEYVEEVADEKSNSEELIAKEASEIADSIAKAIEEVEFIANSHESPVYKKPDPAEIAKFNESMEEFEIDELDVQGDTDRSSDWSDAEINLEDISEDILNHAATKIQAQYRGYKTRQMLKRQKYLQNHHHQKSGARTDSSSTTKSTNSRVPELHGFVECDELQNAATKIQAGVRGFLVRRAMRKLREGRRNSGAREGIYACVRRGSRRHSDVIPRQSSGPPLRRWDPTEFTRQLGSMHEVVAATIIQAYFRGYRARKHLGRVARKTKSLDQFSFAPSNRENLAAIKIQAAFRGYKTRKTLNVSPRTSRPHSALSNTSDGNNQDKDKAATKIQANFRGHRVRQQLRKKASEDLNCP